MEQIHVTMDGIESKYVVAHSRIWFLFQNPVYHFNCLIPTCTGQWKTVQSRFYLLYQQRIRFFPTFVVFTYGFSRVSDKSKPVNNSIHRDKDTEGDDRRKIRKTVVLGIVMASTGM
jgi:hypothetical protein